MADLILILRPKPMGESSTVRALHERRFPAVRAGCAFCQLLATLLVLHVMIAQPCVVFAQNELTEIEDFEPIFVPAPREVTRALARSRQFSNEEKYSNAVDELSIIIEADEGSDDYFIRSSIAPQTWTSVLTEVTRLIGQMPPRGREIYEIKFGIKAKELLARAVAKQDIDEIRRISATYFHTQAGYAATMLLGRYSFDAGEPLAAAFCYKRIIDTPEARAIYQPQVYLLLANAWNFAGESDKAATVLREFSKRFPEAKLQVAGRDLPLFTNNSEALDWLNQHVGLAPPFEGEILLQWAMHRGNAQRLGQSEKGVPLIQPRWQTVVNQDVRNDEIVRNLLNNYIDESIVAIPTVGALAVGDCVIMRSAEHVYGIDFESGKRLWMYPWQDMDVIGQAADTESIINERAFAESRPLQVEQRLFDDLLYGQISSDGQRVYFIDDAGYASKDNYSLRSRNNRFANPMAPRNENRLVALDIRDDVGRRIDGMLSWWVGDVQGLDEPQLAGAFFMGPPLPVQDSLYVICELNQELRLVALDNKSGRLLWSQQIAAVELTGEIAEDGIRRLAGATPSYADGVLICPTAIGAIVAIDAATRRLLWGFRYPRFNEQDVRRYSNRTFENRRPGQKWADGTITISGNDVIVTPIESDEMYCLDLLTGESKWERVARESDVYVAGVYQDQVILVGNRRVRSLRLQNGTQNWELGIADGLISGRGYLNHDRLYLPTTASEIVQIRLDQGTIESQVATAVPLGNLITHRGRMISHGADLIACYPLDEAAKEQVAKLLADDPQAAEAILLQSQLLMNDGNYLDAVDLLSKLYQREPDFEGLDLLGRAMVGALQADFSGAIEKTGSLEHLLAGSERQRIYLRLKLDGLVQMQRADLAMQSLLELIAAPGLQRADYLKIDHDRSVRWDRWVQLRVQTMIEQCSPDQLDSLKNMVQKAIAQKRETGSLAELQRFSQFLGQTALGEHVDIELARRYLLEAEYLSAESTFSSLLTSQQPEIVATARAGLARVLDATDQLHAALREYRILAENYPQQDCWEGMTGSDLLAEALSDSRFARLKRLDWNFGQVQLTDLENRSESYQSFSMRTFANLLNEGPVQLQLELDSDSSGNIYIRDEYGRTLGSVSLVEPGKEIRNPYFNAPTYMQRGHLLVIVAGYAMVGVDLYRLLDADNELDPVLWRIDNGPPTPTNARTTSINIRPSRRENDFGAMILKDIDNQGNPIGNCCWPTADSFCFIRESDLVCVDPRTGKPNWTRKAILELGCDCLSDHNVVFTFKDRTVRQFSLNDGIEIPANDLPEYSDYWTKFGSKLFAWQRAAESSTLFTFDVASGQKTWEMKIDNACRLHLINQHTVAILNAKNELTILDLETGERKLETRFATDLIAKSLIILEDDANYYVGLNTRTAFNNDRIEVDGYYVQNGGHGSICDGQVYAINKLTGERIWQSPIMLDKFAFSARQPAGIPCLIFVRQMQSADRQNERLRSYVELFVADKRDGRELLHLDRQRQSLVGLRIMGSPTEQEVRVEFSTKGQILKFTNQPAPPAAPLQTGVYSSLLLTRSATLGEFSAFMAKACIGNFLLVASRSPLYHTSEGDLIEVAENTLNFFRRAALRPVPLEKD
jgi:outer membrane protein assembly factor BamB/lipopolysaccharide biosynthesis regulator YciM